MPASDPFRDFGLLPPDAPPPERVRGYYSAGRIVGQYIATGLLVALTIGLVSLFILFAPPWFQVLGIVAVVAGFGAIGFLATHNDYRWIELDGDTLRAKHLYTGRELERRVDEIECLSAIYHAVTNATVMIVEGIWGRIKGVEIRFRDGRTPLRVHRYDPAMTNARELIEAVMCRMKALGEVDVDVVNLDGAPLVRHVFWKGEAPKPRPNNQAKIMLCCGIILGLLFGTIGCLWGAQEQYRRDIAAKPPQTIPLAKLIEMGPGDNPHVIVTDFAYGGHVVEMKGDAWQTVWIAMYPRDELGPVVADNEIRAVLKSKSIFGENDLKMFVRRERVKGICSTATRTNFGTELGPNLRAANGGAVLTAAWDIDEFANPPSAEFVRSIFGTSAACLILTIGLAAAVFLRRN